VDRYRTPRRRRDPLTSLRPASYPPNSVQSSGNGSAVATALSPIAEPLNAPAVAFTPDELSLILAEGDAGTRNRRCHYIMVTI
jgi:hypothetical protein